jgi:hypothetical protein
MMASRKLPNLEYSVINATTSSKVPVSSDSEEDGESDETPLLAHAANIILVSANMSTLFIIIIWLEIVVTVIGFT